MQCLQPAVVQSTLEHTINISLDWLNVNFMVANPTKFQAMFLGKHDPQIKINVKGRAIGLLTSVKLLGIQIVEVGAVDTGEMVVDRQPDEVHVEYDHVAYPGEVAAVVSGDYNYKFR